MDTPWQPANAVEAALQDARECGDEQRYLAVLAESVLLVPVAYADDAAGGAAQLPAFASARLDDGTVALPAFTSREAQARPEAPALTGQQLALPFVELAAHWPDPQWVLAVNPGLPVAGHLYGTDLPGVIAAVFAPVNDAERALAAAPAPGDVVAALVAAELRLPVPPTPGMDLPELSDPAFPWWRGTSAVDDEAPVVPAFTSLERLRGRLHLTHPDLDSVAVDLLALAESWPDPQWALAVNPGAPFAVTLVGEQLGLLARRVPDALAAGVTLQVVVPPELLPAYLEQGYDKVAGLVHLCPAEPLLPVQLYHHLDLLRPGSPFSVSDQSVHVVRWQPERAVGVRWVRDRSPRTETVQVPGGAQLVELRATGAEHLVATYHPDRHFWTPADPAS